MIYFQLFTTFRYKSLKNSDSLSDSEEPVELAMKQTRQFGYLAENRLVIWRNFVWLFGDRVSRFCTRLSHEVGFISVSCSEIEVSLN